MLRTWVQAQDTDVFLHLPMLTARANIAGTFMIVSPRAGEVLRVVEGLPEGRVHEIK